MTRLPRRTFLSLLASTLLAACGGGSSGKTSTLAGPSNQRPPQGNIIQRENAKSAEQGVTSQWQIADGDYASNYEIEGYASATSVNRGESINLYVNTADPYYTISIYRIGWYGGQGGRLVAGPIRRQGVRQPPPAFDPGTRLVECNWTDPYVLSIPASADPTDWASGIYLAKLSAESSGKQSYIIFAVRDDARDAALLFQASVTTYAAYNNWGGYSFYDVDSVNNQPACKLSFNRPYRNPQRPHFGKGAGDFLSWEINMLRFVEREGFDVSYSTNIAVHQMAGRLLRHRAFLSVGHDEYWTREMRDAMEGARDSGVNLAFFGANAGYWQVRLEPSQSGQSNRTVVCYKYLARTEDPVYLNGPDRTLTSYLWREQVDPPINRPEASLIGVMYDFNSVDADMVMSDCSSWICAGTDLAKGDVLRGLLGYEVDRVDPASSPPGIQILASSPYAGEGGVTKDAHMTYYTAPCGAGVFATGSMQWNWGVDDFGTDCWGDRVNPAVQQMTRNVLQRFSGA